jgi:hypothetical protein
VLIIRDFRFATKCGPGRVTRAIRVGPHYRFVFNGGGIALSGSFVDGAFVGNFFGGGPSGPGGAAHGTVHFRTPQCDSGALLFAAS